jgi:hypothetical protein
LVAGKTAVEVHRFLLGLSFALAAWSKAGKAHPISNANKEKLWRSLLLHQNKSLGVLSKGMKTFAKLHNCGLGALQL